MSGRRPNCDSGEPDLWSNGSVFMEPSKPISIDPSPHIPLQETTDSTVQRLPCSIPYPGPRLPEVGRPLYDLVAREDDQFEGLLSFCSLLGPVLDPYQRGGQLVGPDHPCGYRLRRVGDRATGVVGNLRADHHWRVVHVVGEVDPYAAVRGASPGVLVGVDVVAGQVHRCCLAQGYTKEQFPRHESPRCARPLAILLSPLDVHAANTSIYHKVI